MNKNPNNIILTLPPCGHIPPKKYRDAHAIKLEGSHGVVRFKNKRITILQSGTILEIPPNTPYSVSNTSNDTDMTIVYMNNNTVSGPSF